MRAPLAVALAGTFLTAALVSGPALGGPQDKCTCKHLEVLRGRRTEAQKMYAYEKALEKQLIEEQTKIAVSDAGRQDKEEGYKNLRKTGNAKVAADTDHLITFDPKTCEPVAKELARHLANMPCAEAAAIEKAHEDFHHDVCTAFKNGDKKPAPVRRTTTPIDDELLGGLHMELPSVDALEEATAYAATVKAYDALIDKLERGQQYTLIMKSLTRMDWKVPMGPVGSAAEYAWTANFPLTVADGPEPRAVSGRAIRNFEGRLIGGQCQYTGMPMLIDTAIDGTLADGRFQLKFNQKGMTLPPFGVQCPRGAGMAGPAQMVPQGPNDIEVEAVDKAKWVYDYAKTPMATMVAPVARVSGDATVEVEACTKDE